MEVLLYSARRARGWLARFAPPGVDRDHPIASLDARACAAALGVAYLHASLWLDAGLLGCWAAAARCIYTMRCGCCAAAVLAAE